VSSHLPGSSQEVLSEIRKLENYMHASRIYFSENTELQLTIALRLLRIIANLTRGGDRHNQLFYRAEKELNFHILRLPAYKEPIPKVSELSDVLWEKQYGAGMNWNEQEGLELLDRFAKYSNEYLELLNNHKFNPDEGAFRYHDPAIYYCMIRHFNPKQIIEVGVGSSTKIASLARRNETIITGIDPYYEPDIQGIKLIRKEVQQIPVTEFKKLEKNDILFIDGSHVSKIGSDVNYLFLEVLPQLNDGVIIHIHDIHLPGEYPKSWIKSKAIFYNEQYLLHAFLIYNYKFKVLLSNSYMARFHPEALLRIYSGTTIGGGSFWIQKAETAHLF
jgi:hypothetical protein